MVAMIVMRAVGIVSVVRAMRMRLADHGMRLGVRIRVAFMRRVVPERLGIVPDEMGGGHLVALSRPEELVERLEAYRAEYVDVR